MNNAAPAAVPDTPPAPPRLRAFAITAVVVLLIAQQAMLWWLYYHAGAKDLVGDEGRYWNVAQSILAGGPWHPSDIWPPAQPLFIAMVLLFGGGLLAVQVVQTLLFAGCAWLIWHLSRRVTGNALAAAIAAALFVLAPSNAAYAHYLWPEITHLFFLLLALDLLLARRARPLLALAAGVSIGLALMFKSLLTAFWPLLLVCFVVNWRPLKIHWRAASVFVVALAATVAPAVIAGHRNTGHWSIADSSAINLLIGLGVPDRNDYISWPGSHLFEQYVASGTTPDERNAWTWQQVDERLQARPLATTLWQQLSKQYFRLLESKTLLLTQLPGPACAGYLGVYHDVPPWLALTARWSSHLFHALILAGFAFGVCLWRDWRSSAAWLLLAFVGYQAALYLGLLAIARYMLQFMPVFCLFAGVAFARVWQAQRGAAVSYGRLAAGALFASLLLWLAFAGPWLDGYCRA